VDANYKFVFIDIGAHGGRNEGGMFSNCMTFQNLKKNYHSSPKCNPEIEL
jgi:hypothetical protein